MKIEITEKFLKDGIHTSSDKCPAGLALQELFPHSRIFLSWHGMHDHDICCTIDGETVNFPKEAAVKIRDWEDGKAVEPFEFELEISGKNKKNAN